MGQEVTDVLVHLSLEAEGVDTNALVQSLGEKAKFHCELINWNSGLCVDGGELG